MFEAIKCKKEIHSLEITVYCLTTYSLFISPPSLKKQQQQQKKHNITQSALHTLMVLAADWTWVNIII